MTEKEKMLAGLLYDPSDPELAALRQRAHVLSKRYNDTDETREAERRAILQELLPDCGESVYLQGPVQFDSPSARAPMQTSTSPVWTVLR